jgi:hypothetical protein
LRNFKETNGNDFGGKEPFSEKETIAISAYLKSLNATLFVSVHSGALAMYIPYGYKGEVP